MFSVRHLTACTSLRLKTQDELELILCFCLLLECIVKEQLVRQATDNGVHNHPRFPYRKCTSRTLVIDMVRTSAKTAGEANLTRMKGERFRTRTHLHLWILLDTWDYLLAVEISTSFSLFLIMHFVAISTITRLPSWCLSPVTLWSLFELFDQ